MPQGMPEKIAMLTFDDDATLSNTPTGAGAAPATGTHQRVNAADKRITSCGIQWLAQVARYFSRTPTA